MSTEPEEIHFVPVDQIQVANPRARDQKKTMTSMANYSYSYAKALLYGTKPEQMVDHGGPKRPKKLKPEEIARMQEEASQIERDLKMYRDAYGENSLKFNAAQRYLKKLLENPRVVRFLENRQRDILDEFRELVSLEAH